MVANVIVIATMVTMEITMIAMLVVSSTAIRKNTSGRTKHNEGAYN